MSEARVRGYRDYYDGVNECPYSYDEEREDWEDWCDGHNDAYCEDEDK